MIRKHIDVVAILMLLAAFGVAARGRQAAARLIHTRLVHTRLEACRRPRPVQVRIGPFKFNFDKLRNHVNGASRLI
jgi:hypothetical protein